MCTPNVADEDSPSCKETLVTLLLITAILLLLPKDKEKHE